MQVLRPVVERVEINMMAGDPRYQSGGCKVTKCAAQTRKPNLGRRQCRAAAGDSSRLPTGHDESRHCTGGGLGIHFTGGAEDLGAMLVQIQGIIGQIDVRDHPNRAE